MKMRKYPCIQIKQSAYTLVVTAIPANELYAMVKANRREDDKEKGYQRTLTPNRRALIARFIDEGNPIPTNIVVAFDSAKLDKEQKHIIIPDGDNVGWVIDGQHRLAGAFDASKNIDLPITAFLNLDLEQQVNQFITINREAKKVPTSLYLDLLPELTLLKKTLGDQAKERAVDLANSMKGDEESPFFGRIASLTSPSKGQISLTNFVRKIAPLVHPGTGLLRTRTEFAQRAMINNYFSTLKEMFPEVYSVQDNLFFKTLGFGAVMNAFPDVVDITLRRNPEKFKVEHVKETFEAVASFDFSTWREIGTGSAAEIVAGKQLSDALKANSNVDLETDTIEV